MQIYTKNKVYKQQFVSNIMPGNILLQFLRLVVAPVSSLYTELS